MKLSELSLVLLVIAAFLILFLPEYPGPASQPQISRVCFRETCFSVELATTPEQQTLGLMNRTYLDSDKGMLFIFPEEGIYPFWMKDTLIPLDMIWIDSNRTVVFIGRNEQPCGPGECPAINPGVPARYVLELNAGSVERIGLKGGDKVTFELD